MPTDVVGNFHPAVLSWFREKFPAGASEPQRRGWPAISAGGDVLVAAPTGSGKTLTGFMVAIDRLYAASDAGHTSGRDIPVVYVSPLKALAVDVQVNLRRPLEEIALHAEKLGFPAHEINVAVRTGDTPASDRAAMLKAPPDILVTTPESLYLLLTAEKSRAMLRHVEAVIIDEIHALARDKRGSHLSVSLERLDALQEGPRPQRIGLSATQKPIEVIAELLVGTGSPEIIDCGHLRDASLSIMLPQSELDAVISDGQFREILGIITDEVRAHRTTLVFVNTRRMAERVAHLLGEILGDEQEKTVCAHHGSLSKERRTSVENRLRAGELAALVATASLELGIDVGPVDLVCQIGSPRSIATFLQRVGRSNHSLGGKPKGLLFPTTRDELVECAALMGAARDGRLDAVLPPVAPLDILAQQLAAEVASRPREEGCSEEELFALVRRAAPYSSLTRSDFDDVVSLLSDGIRTGRGTRGALLHRDSVNQVLRPRRGARLAALTGGGAIPEVGDYRVILEPSDTFLGTVNEDFAIESMVGDVFLLGTHAWRIRQVTAGTVRVGDAAGAHPTIPFWVGEAPARTAELSGEVSALRAAVEARLGSTGPSGAVEQLRERYGIDADAAGQIASYLAAGRDALGVLPTCKRIVFERFFDQAGGMQLVVHAPLGGRANRALGLALRKRFCATFDFELQAAAGDDAVVLSLGPQHSFPLDNAARLLRSHTAAEVLTQAVLTSPLFAARWRWNLTRALVVPRMRAGARYPVPLQRMEADDLMAAVFPALAACQENTPAGPVPLPDHVLVRQTVHDCLHEALDADALVSLLASIECGDVECVFVDSPEPSVLSHEILTSRPYTFLDDTPLEERRTRAVPLQRGLPLESLRAGALDPVAIERVRSEVAPNPRDPEELHDLLLSLVIMRPVDRWAGWFTALDAAGRVATVDGPGRPAGSADSSPGRSAGPAGVNNLWCAIEKLGVARGALFGDDAAAAAVLRGHLDVSGPADLDTLASATGLAPTRVRVALGILEEEGTAMRGAFGVDKEDVGQEDPDQEMWCARRVLARIHAYTRDRRRQEVRAVSQDDFMAFLAAWQHVADGSRRVGQRGLAEVIDQLQGIEIAAGTWEPEILAARVEGYRPEWLDDLCLSGEVVWGRFAATTGGTAPPKRGAATPTRATPVTFARREDAGWLLQVFRWPGFDCPPPDRGASREVAALLADRGALFYSEIREGLDRLPTEIEEGLWDLVARGLATADGFQAVRGLLSSRETWRRHAGAARGRSPGSRGAAGLTSVRARSATRLGLASRLAGGRWSLLPAAASVEPGDTDALAEAVAGQLLARWGVVFYDLFRRERFSIPWREVLWALRRLEARGQVRGGHFVTGVSGEQYALPGAVDELRNSHQRSWPAGALSPRDPVRLAAAALAMDLAG